MIYFDMYLTIACTPKNYNKPLCSCCSGHLLYGLYYQPISANPTESTIAVAIYSAIAVAIYSAITVAVYSATAVAFYSAIVVAI